MPSRSSRASRFAAAQDLRQVVDAAGREMQPVGGTARPVALAIAAISIADLVPSRNELNICGFIPPRSASSGVRP